MKIINIQVILKNIKEKRRYLDMKKEFGATKNGEKASCYVLKNAKEWRQWYSDFGASLTETLCTG